MPKAGSAGYGCVIWPTSASGSIRDSYCVPYAGFRRAGHHLLGPVGRFAWRGTPQGSGMRPVRQTNRWIATPREETDLIRQ